MIKVFGQEAKEIESGQVFIARVDFIKGRKLVTMIPSIIVDRDMCPSFEVRY